MQNHINISIEESYESAIKTPSIRKKNKLKQVTKHISEFDSWQKNKLDRIKAKQDQKSRSEMRHVKHFRCQSTKYLPKNYKNPFDGYKERAAHKHKNSVARPPIGKPTINPVSTSIIKEKDKFEKNTWKRMENYNHQMKVNKSVSDLLYVKKIMDETPSFKPDIRLSQRKRNKSENSTDV
jgi:hypothetical protein